MPNPTLYSFLQSLIIPLATILFVIIQFVINVSIARNLL